MARVRLNGEERWIDAADAGLYRDALGAAPPGGLPAAFLEDVPDALAAAGAAVRRHPRAVHDRRDPRLATAIDASAVLRELERDGVLVRGELRPGGSEREWCDPDVLRRLRRASLAVLRKEIEPAEQRELARFLPAWQGDRPPPAVGCRDRPPARDARAAAGSGAAGRGVGARRPAATGRRLLAGVDGPAVRERRAGLDRRRRAGTQLGSRGAVLPRGSGAARAAAVPRRAACDPTQHEAVRERLAAGACFFTDLLVDVALDRRGDPGGAVGSRLGGRRDERRVRAVARAAPDARPRAARAAPRRRDAPVRRRTPPQRRRGSGPGALVADGATASAPPSTRSRAGGRSASCCSSATGS